MPVSRLARLVLLLALCAAGASLRAADAPRPPPQADAPERIGAGTLRWLGLHVYDAALWAPRRPFDAEAPFVLVLRYARALPGSAIADRSLEEMARVEAGTRAERARWGERMRALFPDVVAGDTIAGEYLPGRGARFWLNGRPLGDIAEPAFARAFFAIWLDPGTRLPTLRAALLGAAR